MEQNLTRIFTLFGGLALFLYGMDALSHSLETAAGSRLKSLLAAVTGSPVRGVLAGAAVTAVLQSSSAVTVMVLGFVSAGLLTLRQAVPVIFGCNIGTTVTAQLLAFRLEDVRGLVLLVGYRCSSVYYERAERIAGESHYPLKKMLAFAFDGITSLSVKPLRLITLAGMLVSAVSFVAIIVTLITKLVGFTVTGWTSMICAIYFLGGVQLLGIGIIGEYVGKIYNETKARPRFIISETTFHNS